MYVQNSIFLSFLKNENIISSLFDISYLCRYRLFLFLRFSISLLKNNLQGKNFIMLPDVTPLRTYNDAVVWLLSTF